MIGPLVKSLRPVQWVKNVFVLAPIVFAERLADPALLVSALLAFVTFCLAASCIYLVNDLGDREDDRRHPLKKHRPIAAGKLSVSAAWIAAAVLATTTLGASLYLGIEFLVILAIYLAVNVAYSRGLKRVVILDVMVVAAGYVFRVMAGAAAIEVEVSPWLLLCTIFLALLLILSKRSARVVAPGGRRGRPPGRLAALQRHLSRPDDQRRHRLVGGVLRALRHGRRHGRPASAPTA